MPLRFKDLVKKRKIYFVSQGKTLDTKIKNYGQYYQHLEKHIAQQINGPLTIGGKELTNYLEDHEHMYELTDFLVGLLPYSKETIRAHVWADMILLEQHYPRPDEDFIENAAGTFRIDIHDWLSEISYCEKFWNLALCNAFGGLIGSPGYEWPTTEEAFAHCVVSHATQFIIGTPKQLERYTSYADLTDNKKEKKSIKYILDLFGRS